MQHKNTNDDSVEKDIAVPTQLAWPHYQEGGPQLANSEPGFNEAQIV
ncbi:MAG: hypothetical protein IIA09_09345 [Proteobacteria bacterium]|jgi:hypothetical protein|nr:hypothetical protein [Pseudomonadota bacterium]